MVSAPSAAFDPHPLWRFSLEHYRADGVAQACIQLQDGYGLDVNVALACIWHERRGGTPLDPSWFDQIHAALSPPRRWAADIRALRREAREHAAGGPVYEALKHAELLAENLVQRQLFDRLCDLETREPPGSGHASLVAYARSRGASLPSGLLRAVLLADR